MLNGFATGQAWTGQFPRSEVLSQATALSRSGLYGRVGRHARYDALLHVCRVSVLSSGRAHMSVFEPDTTDRSRDATELPNFPVVLRGYDRQQVTAYVEELGANLEGERQRADQAERHMAQMQLEISSARNQPPPTFEHLGAQAARVLEQAGMSAERLVEEAQVRADGIVADAEAQSSDLVDAAEQQAEQLDREAAQRLAEAGRQRDRMLAAAEHDAEQVRAGADADARRMLAEARTLAERIRREAEEERAATEAEADQLQDIHDSLLRHLSQVHGELGDVLAARGDG